MVSRNSSPRPKKSVSLSVMLGTFLVPLSAYAASSLVETSGVAESVTAPDTPVVESAANTAPSIGADLETACGEAGLGMVAAETDGTISQLQQAALDALRGICAEQGMPLPAPPAPRPVATQATPPAPTGDQGVVASEHHDHHGRHGGDDDDEDDHGRHGGDDDDEDDHGRHGEDHD